jgi:hypothetical protein
MQRWNCVCGRCCPVLTLSLSLSSPSPAPFSSVCAHAAATAYWHHESSNLLPSMNAIRVKSEGIMFHFLTKSYFMFSYIIIFTILCKEVLLAVSSILI